MPCKFDRMLARIFLTGDVQRLQEVSLLEVDGISTYELLPAWRSSKRMKANR
jgi:hypothetical protein